MVWVVLVSLRKSALARTYQGDVAHWSELATDDRKNRSSRLQVPLAKLGTLVEISFPLCCQCISDTPKPVGPFILVGPTYVREVKDPTGG